MSNEEKCVGKKPRKVLARVISQEGHCPIGHKVGDVIEFDHFGVKGDICVNALFTMLPVVYSLMHNAYFKLAEDQFKEHNAIQDTKNTVFF